jgi:hypothetical protein
MPVQSMNPTTQTVVSAVVAKFGPADGGGGGRAEACEIGAATAAMSASPAMPARTVFFIFCLCSLNAAGVAAQRGWLTG